MLHALIAAAALTLTGPQIGSPAPDFHLTTLDGKRVSLADFRGKTVVINDWATWCPPCRLETPDLIAAAKKFSAQGDVVFLGIDSTESAPIVHAFLAAKPMGYAQAIDDDKAFSKAYDVRAYPTTFVISGDGVLRARYAGNIAPKVLAGFVGDARSGRNGVLATAAQRPIGPGATGRMRQVMEMVGLWDRKDSVVGTFSGGMRRRLEIARGLMHSPRVLFLDEPTIGLDPQTRRSIWDYIRELKEREEITIFMTTHYMDEAEWCDRIAIMDHGEIVALDSPEALKAGVGQDRVTIHTDDDEAAIAALERQFGIEAQVREGAVVFGVRSGEQFVPRLFAEFELPIRSVSVSRPTLDDVFMSYTGSTIRDAEEDSSKHRNRVMMQMMSGGRR